MFHQHILAAFQDLPSSCSFMGIREYHNNYQEVANYLINFRASYHQALLRSQAILESLAPQNDLDTQARAELLASVEASLTGDNPAYTCAGVYRTLAPGIKLHQQDDILHVWGLVQGKKVLVPGVYPNRRSRPLTLAKNHLRKSLPINRYRQFKIVPGNYGKLLVRGLEIQ